MSGTATVHFDNQASMYSKPTLEKFGTFRSLTQVGFSGGSDGYIILGPPTDDSPPTSDIGCDLRGCTSS